MSALVIILLGTVLIQASSIVLGQSRAPLQARLSLSIELREAAFTLVSITVSSVLGYTITDYLLKPWKLEFLRTPVLLLATAAAILSTRALIDTARLDARHQVVVMMTNQCALLGVTLFVTYYADSWTEAFLYGLGSAAALAVLSASFKLLLERIDTTAVPFVFRGIPLSLISAGLMALALMGFAGIVKN